MLWTESGNNTKQVPLQDMQHVLTLEAAEQLQWHVIGCISQSRWRALLTAERAVKVQACWSSNTSAGGLTAQTPDQVTHRTGLSIIAKTRNGGYGHSELLTCPDCQDSKEQEQQVP